MSDLVLLPMTRKEFLGLPMDLRRRILARQSTLHLINEAREKDYILKRDVMPLVKVLKRVLKQPGGSAYVSDALEHARKIGL
jgi:hypothetical protein